MSEKPKCDMPPVPNPRPPIGHEVVCVDGSIRYTYRWAGSGWTMKTERIRNEWESKWKELSTAAGTGVHFRHLTGHDELGFLRDRNLNRSNSDVEAVKDRLFGSRTGASEMFWYHRTQGLIVSKAATNTTHRDVQANPSKWLTDPNERKAVADQPNLVAFGRIEHRGGAGWIHVMGMGGEHSSNVPREVLRLLWRRYPKHKITDGHGTEITESCRRVASFREWKLEFETR